MMVWNAKSSLILPSFLARCTMAPAHTSVSQYLGCYSDSGHGGHQIFSAVQLPLSFMSFSYGNPRILQLLQLHKIN